MDSQTISLIDILEDIYTDITSIEEDKLMQEKEITDLQDIIKLVIESLNKIDSNKRNITDQLSALEKEVNNKYFDQIYNVFSKYHSNPLEKYKTIYNIINSLLNEIKRMEYLSHIGEENVILVGGNGVGKSSFASYLKDSMSSNIVVIPAQKFLFYDKMINSLHLTNKALINNIQKENLIGRGRFQNNSNDYDVKRFMTELSELFSKLVTVIVNEQVSEEHSIIKSENMKEELKDETILYKLNYLWNTLIPDINFDIDTTNRTLIPIKNEEKYSLNAMSDGEKAMLYYISHVFLAEENSFIVIDEPETFLNASNFNRLWDTLESYRKDCKFIYISHVIDFIVTRSNANLLWCKSYTYPDEWEIKSLEYEENLSKSIPKELLSEILGVRKPILFCEGKKGALDYLVYTGLFREDLVVCPVESHTQVIQYTRAYNDSPMLNNNQAIGIIDSDLMSEEQIDIYEKDGIYTLPFNEIEMIFFTEEVIDSVLSNVFPLEEVEEKKSEFKRAFLELVNQEKQDIVKQKMKKYIDNQLSNYRINTLETSDKMITEVKLWLNNLNLSNIEKSFSINLERIIQEDDYNGLLKISPQKKSVSKGLANKLLDSNYEYKAKNKIKLDKELADEIKRKYFSHIMFE